jgi:hypothetical protein
MAEKNFSYYARIVMIIILSIEFLLNIVFLAIISDIKDTHKFTDLEKKIMDQFEEYYYYWNFYFGGVSYPLENLIFSEHYDAISAIFSLFFISFFFFVVEFIIFCSFMESDCPQFCNILGKELNHLMTLITFFICQFLYFIDCLIIPVYFQRVTKILIKENYNDYKSLKRKYASLIVVAYVFLFIILFMDFIVLNLYKGICCEMTKICQKTQKCCKNFGWFLGDKLSCNCLRESDESNQNPEIYNLNGEIKSLLAENIQIRINKNNLYNY